MYLFLFFNLKELRNSDCLNSTGTKSYIFGPTNDNTSVLWYAEYSSRLQRCEDNTNLFWTEILLLELLETNLCKFWTCHLQKVESLWDVFKESCLDLLALEMMTYCLDMWSFELFHVYNLFYYSDVYCGTSILTDNNQIINLQTTPS